jgi:hypothetical protein
LPGSVSSDETPTLRFRALLTESDAKAFFYRDESEWIG